MSFAIDGVPPLNDSHYMYTKLKFCLISILIFSLKCKILCCLNLLYIFYGNICYVKFVNIYLKPEPYPR